MKAKNLNMELTVFLWLASPGFSSLLEQFSDPNGAVKERDIFLLLKQGSHCGFCSNSEFRNPLLSISLVWTLLRSLLFLLECCSFVAASEKALALLCWGLISSSGLTISTIPLPKSSKDTVDSFSAFWFLSDLLGVLNRGFVLLGFLTTISKKLLRSLCEIFRLLPWIFVVRCCNAFKFKFGFWACRLLNHP